mmetsp:Transcript_17488/g.31578  ORF Transcript_17488/g.31578 Transcript_17488/m.31578 type:complete len:216 (-) Transcript_17488:874-1521(-)
MARLFYRAASTSARKTSLKALESKRFIRFLGSLAGPHSSSCIAFHSASRSGSTAYGVMQGLKIGLPSSKAEGAFLLLIIPCTRPSAAEWEVAIPVPHTYRFWCNAAGLRLAFGSQQTGCAHLGPPAHPWCITLESHRSRLPAGHGILFAAPCCTPFARSSSRICGLCNLLTCTDWPPGMRPRSAAQLSVIIFSYSSLWLSGHATVHDVRSLQGHM